MSNPVETSAVAVGVVTAIVLLTRRNVRQSAAFRATVSPLASIMGSGFLVVAPLLANIVGAEAVLVMAALCAFAFAIGHVIRRNIEEVEPLLDDGAPRTLRVMSTTADVLLGVSYVISVAFYLGLLSDLLVNEVGLGGGETMQRVLTTVVLAGIGVLAATRGLGVVQRGEQAVTTINLAMITGLVLALVIDNIRAAIDGSWGLAADTGPIDSVDIRQLLGVVIVVQGFEISRYQGERFGASTRIGAMRRAQLVSTGIYLVFIGALTHRFGEFTAGTDALLEIVSIGRDLTPVLPALIVIAAIGSQLSASIADADGGAGLISEATGTRITTLTATIAIIAGAIALTWITDLGVVIAVASRCFAAYYAVQIAIHLHAGRRARRTWIELGPAVLLLLLTVAVAVLALPSE